MPKETEQTKNGRRKRRSATPPYSEIDLNRWKDYDDIITGSLWLLGARDRTGPHVGDYWGNFVPQIATQVLRRFTKKGEIVLDLFSGMGTTLIECRHLGRHGIGVELVPEVAVASERRIAEAANPDGVYTRVLVADSTQPSTRPLVAAQLAELGAQGADCVILHPPYHDIIRFSSDPNDLSNAPDLDSFLAGFKRAAENARDLLRPGRFMALVIGDKFAKSEIVPLGFECMQVCRQLAFQLKAINVKDIQGNERGKGKNENLWRYRALREGFYIFKHEYVMIFRKPTST
ncbi:MAG: TRM11 family SAM-dependent methyltransferase [Chloroflexota bacterium]|mgnify:FL=1